jgi:hypothetical protein
VCRGEDTKVASSEADTRALPSSVRLGAAGGRQQADARVSCSPTAPPPPRCMRARLCCLRVYVSTPLLLAQVYVSTPLLLAPDVLLLSPTDEQALVGGQSMRSPATGW